MIFNDLLGLYMLLLGLLLCLIILLTVNIPTGTCSVERPQRHITDISILYHVIDRFSNSKRRLLDFVV